MKEFWDDRYKENEYAYGIEPNKFFKDTLDAYKFKGNILLPGDGEGRNAIYAAKKGLNVHAFDISIEGKKKALKLAEIENVTINYEVGNFYDLDLNSIKFDAGALIFTHFPVEIVESYHTKIASLIKSNGIIIIEAYSKNHSGNGGPKNPEMLFSKEMIQQHFSNFSTLKLEEIEVDFSEGKYHQGLGTVIRFVGKKNN
ncbi:class I SAM-dependent methyltransferase [Lutibacter sp. TH_r2]|uniref:class I SAM-dependent methyltransferase n=1 Tax=Lutibacter sp. TH_r2 TaxID=3082083 RepID=UPI0029557705|nr:class I SAM-dependent methyltransferase [Lutibacter sp. TH_r2]MDV7186121.1 class I SAM-dependent methyltransferase [Lutibacter sp. TH_r2]